jgi:chemotaxis protein CheX
MSMDPADADREPIPENVRNDLLEPFIAGTTVTLREMAGSEALAQTLYQSSGPVSLGDVNASLELTGASKSILVLSFQKSTAHALARRLLAGAGTTVDEELVADCIAELANVIAGQAKTLLVGTPFHFTLGTPTVLRGVPDESPARGRQRCLVVDFTSDLGEFALQLWPQSGP